MSLLGTLGNLWTGGASGALGSLFGGGGGLGGGDPFASPAKANWIKAGFAPAFAEVNKGTATAADYLRQAYQGAFQQRAGGLAAGYSDQAQRLGAQGASQGLSGDIIQRMLTGQGAQLQSQIGQARGEAQQGLNVDLAQLYKGTGTELAGLTTDQLAVMSNYLSALTGAKATTQGAEIGAMGNLIGTGLKVLPFL